MDGAVSDGAPAAPAAAVLALVPVQQLDDLLPDPVQVRAQPDQHLGGHALALADQAKQDVLGADVVVAKLQRLTQRQLEHLLGPRGERDVPGRRLLALADDLLNLLAHRLQADPQRLQCLGRDTFTLVDEAEQDMLGADVVVVEHPGFFLSQDHDPPRPVGKPLEHLVAPSPGGRGRQLKSCSSLPHGSPRAGRRLGCDMSHYVRRSPPPGRSPTSNLRPGAVFPATPGANARRASERAT